MAVLTGVACSCNQLLLRYGRRIQNPSSWKVVEMGNPIRKVAEKLLDCGGKPSPEPTRDNAYPARAFIIMKGGRWKEILWREPSIYGCSNEGHHTVYWSLEKAKEYMAEGDWLIEYVPVARYRCSTKETDCDP